MGAESYAEATLTWVEMGADIVGGCCEIGPEHIACIRQALDTGQNG
jgi:S-methylmethionine-dependent homocysteine/selenocysteine methylase